jgi:hypothetical protein
LSFRSNHCCGLDAKPLDRYTVVVELPGVPYIIKKQSDLGCDLFALIMADGEDEGGEEDGDVVGRGEVVGMADGEDDGD